MGVRRKRLDMRMADQRVSRRVNGMRKTKERERRRARMLELLKAGAWPYTSTLRNFLSTELDTPASKLSPDAVKTYLAQA